MLKQRCQQKLFILSCSHYQEKDYRQSFVSQVTRTFHINQAFLHSQLETLDLSKNEEDKPRMYILKCDDLLQNEVVHQIQKIIKQ